MVSPVRYQGEIVEWNDEKGCGFVRPRGSGPNDKPVFLARRAMATRKRAPALGDHVVYEVQRVESPADGRRLRTDLQARRVVFAGEDRPGPARPDKGVVLALGLAYLLAQFGLIPFLPNLFWVALVGLILSLVALLSYGLDKAAAGRGAWRVPEANLHLLALLGGWPGAALAQRLFRHKTRKQEFQTTFRLVCALNVVATATLTWALR